MTQQIRINGETGAVAAVADVDPEELAEYLEMLDAGELTDPADEPVFQLTIKGWGMWSIIPRLGIELKLMKLLNDCTALGNGSTGRRLT